MEKRISFYVKYSEGFTEDIYKKLWNWSVKNSLGLPRGWCDTYERLKQGHYFLFDNWGLGSVKFDNNKIEEQLSYGVDNNSQCIEKELSIKEVMELIDTPSQLLGETEEYKDGDWVVITTWQGGSDEGSVVKLIQAGQCLTYKNDMGIVLSASPECVRLARPEEIPQEEVEYWECIKDPWPYKILGLTCKIKDKKAQSVICNVNGTYEAGTQLFVSLDLIHFKPSTREAYEAQQKAPLFVDCEDCSGTGKTIEGVLLPTGHSERTIDCPTCKGQGEIKNVNKCSTINKNENGTTKSKSSEVLPRKSYDFPRGEGETTTNLPIKRYNFPR